MADQFAPIENVPECRGGMLAGANHLIDSYKADVALKAGVFVTDVGAGYKDIKNLAAITDSPAGVTVYNSAKIPTGDGVNEIAAGEVANVCRRGQIYVITETGSSLAVGGAIHVRTIANGGNTLIGAIRAAADGVNTFSLSGARVVKPSFTVNGVLLTCVELNLP